MMLSENNQHRIADRTLGQWGRGGMADEPLEPVGQRDGGYRLGIRLCDSGEIYEGHHPRIATPFAIKVFRRSVGETSKAVRAFSMEVGRVSILRHPNIAHVVDSGVLADRTPFVATEWLLGCTLDEFMLRRGRLPVPEILPVVRGVALALSAAHSAGVVHREIRPDNVFLLERPDHEDKRVRVVDFGVSQLTWGPHAAGNGITATAAGYLAPEQEGGNVANVDAFADQFGLAALACRLLTGDDRYLPHLYAASSKEHIGGPSPRRSNAWSAVDLVLIKALSVRPRDRFPSVILFWQALEEALLRGGQGVSAQGPTRGIRGPRFATASGRG